MSLDAFGWTQLGFIKQSQNSLYLTSAMSNTFISVYIQLKKKKVFKT